MPMLLVTTVLTASALVTLIACRNESHAGEQPQPGGPAQVSAPARPVQAAGELQVAVVAPGVEAQAAAAPAIKQYAAEAAAVQLKAGGTGTATLTIRPIKGMKFNKEFPAKFTVEATSFAKSSKDKLTFKDGDVKLAGVDGVVTIPLTGLVAGAGPVKVLGNFSVCSEEQCYMLRNEPLALAVTVK